MTSLSRALSLALSLSLSFFSDLIVTKLEFGKEPPLPLKRHTVTSSIGEPILESSIADGEKVQVAVNTMYQFTNSERFMLVLFSKDMTILIRVFLTRFMLFFSHGILLPL